MFKQKGMANSQDVDTLVGANTQFEGNIESQGSIRVDGKIKGNIKTEGDVFVGANSIISGNVYANNVYLSGSVEGNIYASGALRLLSTAKLQGDIEVHSFIADEGGLFQGKCSMLEMPESEKNTQKALKKSSSSKDYKKSSVLEQACDEKEKGKQLNA